ncbi:hypothetical protein SD10_00940 [Spirosoma radiotolerans]|uniref:Peptidoglycan binding-like domain-containing protein n=2 Tax=Spirosoma radiotolerans TaxID=1379870 RepID=A0A0E3V4W7_9BACT|nr:hypothetical protein SD10_00940 [Spirosoma radiotolerans]
MKRSSCLLGWLLSFAVNAQQQAQLPRLTAAERQSVIDTLIAKVNSLYIYEDVAQKMTASIRQHQKHHGYDTISQRTVLG